MQEGCRTPMHASNILFNVYWVGKHITNVRRFACVSARSEAGEGEDMANGGLRLLDVCLICAPRKMW